MGLFALGVFVILAAGGIDVSFTAISAFTMYSVTLLVQTYLPGLPIIVIILIAMAGGVLLGMINGLLVHHLRVPSLIVTIGTQYLFRGFLLSFIGTVWIMSLPPQMGAFGRMPLLQFETANGALVTLPFYFLVLPAAAILTWWILNRTLMGRAIFAVGGNANIAERLGYSLRTVHLFLFGYAGALAGLAGIIHVCANRQANPFDLVGTEMAGPARFSAPFSASSWLWSSTASWFSSASQALGSDWSSAASSCLQLPSSSRASSKSNSGG